MAGSGMAIPALTLKSCQLRILRQVAGENGLGIEWKMIVERHERVIANTFSRKNN